MTPEIAKELLPIIKAFSEGKQIQYFNTSYNEWKDLEYARFDDDPSYYRIKPESKYIPFKSVEECWEEMQKHQPFGWVISIKTENFEQITYVGPNIISLSDSNLSFSTAFDKYKFVDGSPFGIKEE